MKKLLKQNFILSLFICSFSFAQEEVNEESDKGDYNKEIRTSTGLWLGTYTKYRISEKMFYYGEYHYRRRNNFINDMAQIYLRFGLTYLIFLIKM